MNIQHMKQEAFCTYVYKDPKTNVLRYVGEGGAARPHQHLRPGKKSSNPRLSAMLQKRLKEGFCPTPIIIPAPSKSHAVEMEILLIEMIGRDDLGTGTLFNHTNGGDGINGYKHTPEALLKIQSSSTGRSCPKTTAHRAKISLAKSGKKINNVVMTKCPHCLKVGRPSNMVRWHFDNCKDNK